MLNYNRTNTWHIPEPKTVLSPDNETRHCQYSVLNSCKHTLNTIHKNIQYERYTLNYPNTVTTITHANITEPLNKTSGNAYDIHLRTLQN